MRAIQEITSGPGWPERLNHTYLIDDLKALAFIRNGTSEPVFFKSPLFFNRKGRTFKNVSTKLFGI